VNSAGKKTANASISYDQHEKQTVQTERVRLISNHIIYCNKIKYVRNVCKNIEKSCKPLQKVKACSRMDWVKVILNNNNRLSYKDINKNKNEIQFI